MRRQRFDCAPLLLSAIWLAAMVGCGRNESAATPPAVQDVGGVLPAAVSAEQLTNTDILPHTAGAIVPGRNYVYCATFQSAWNELETQANGERIRLRGSPQMAADLHAGPKLGERDLPAGAYLVKAGLVKDGIVDQIRVEMRKQFPKATLQLPDGAAAQTIVAYAYLQKSLPFREAFDVLPEPLRFQSKDGETPVRAFGFRRLHHSARDRAIRRQATVLDYADADNFVLRLNTTVQDEELVLAKVTPEKSLRVTLSGVLQRVKTTARKDFSPAVEDDEPVVVPVISLGVSRRYYELQGRVFENPKGNGLEISTALQRILFRLDQSGARLESDAYVGVKSAKDEVIPRPRRFIFDKPFLVYLKRKSSEVPYFAMWVETPEVLEKAAK